MDEEHRRSEELSRKLGQQLADREQKRSAMEADFKIEKEWRTSLQNTLIEDRERISELQMELSKFKTISRDYEHLQTEHLNLQQTCEEHEQTLQELAAHLGESKLQMDDLKEASELLKDATCTSEKDHSQSCTNCSKKFSITKRRHTCRYCKALFCQLCSSNTIPLPSTTKPVRVCDNCHMVLLQRYSVS